jgi:hypothetical protein
VGSAPFAIESASLVMSDALVAALSVLIAGLIHLQRRWPAAAALAMGLSGALGLLRLSALLVVPAALLALPWRSVGWRAAIWLLPGIVGLGIFQWATFGSPLRSGYDYWLPALRQFDLAYALERPMGDGPTMVGDALDGQLLALLVCPCPTDDGPLAQLPNVLFYPAVVLGPLWIFAPPLVGLLGLVYACRHWCEPAARFTIWLTLLSWGLLSVYVFQAARLAAAPAVLLALYAAVMAGRRLDQRASAGMEPSRPAR